MIPVRLKIQGLYSYQGPQEIVFDPLLEAGLFGIFGGVGSGKSTILEAITFALYGQTDRLNQKGDERNYNMMNLQSSDFLIDFECLAGPENQRYRFVVKAKRNKKRFEDVPKAERSIYLWLENEWRPFQENASGEQIVGLSYDNFRRTIIIPQGRFQDFIELKGQERTEMMKEIFQLQKFDLSAAVGSLLKENRQKLDILSGQLVGLEEIRPEQIEAMQWEEKMQREKLASLTQEFQQLQWVNETLTALAAWKAQEERLQARQQALETQAPAMESLRQQLATFDHVQTNYQTAKAHYDAGVSRWQEWNQKLQNAQKEAAVAQQTWEGLQQQQDTWQQRLQQLDQNRLDLLRWQGEEKLLRIQETIQGILAQKTLLEVQFQGTLQEEKQASDQKIALGQQWEAHQSRLRPDFHAVATQVRQWHQARRTLSQQKQELKAEAERIKNQESVVNQKIADAQAQLAQFGEGVETLYQQERQKWEEAATQWHVRQSWSILIDRLTDNAPCPVCGSKEHPAPAHPDMPLSWDLSEIQQKQKALEARYQLYKQREKELEIHQAGLIPLADQRTEILRRWEQNKEQMLALEAAFPADDSAWREESEFLAWEKAQQSLRTQQDQIQATLRQLDQGLLDIQARKRGIETQLLDFDKQAHAQQALWQAQREQWEVTPEATSVQEAQQRQFSLQQAIEAEEKAWASFEKAYQQGQERWQASQQSLQQWQELVAKETEALHQAKTTLEERCRWDPLVGSWDQLTIWLALFNAQTLPAARATWARYEQERTKWEEAKAQWEIQGKPYAGLTFDAERQALVHQALADLQKQLDEGQHHLGALVQQRTDLERKLQEKSALLGQRAELDQRKSALDTMERLFRGQGFVNFVSRIFLEQLCAVANQRFERMTRGQLQLKIGAENNFWVIDRLHGGKERLLKTLSGGQKFQASLALALALADGIQQKLRLDQHFFFIDEGFGSLDKDSLQVVFETLSSLRQEKRCVGVISHVEELQQEIQTYLLIQRTDSGSHITKSWET